jgi:hypothetical protein
MKRLLLSFIVLTHSLSVHASEQQSWFGRNKTVGIAAASVATATGIFAAINLWAWNNWRNDEDAAQKKVNAAAKLKKQKEALEKAQTSAENINLQHMQKSDVLADRDVADLKKLEHAPAETSQFLHAYERYRKPSHELSTPCEHCVRVNTGDAYNRPRSNACPVFLAAYSPFVNAIGQQNTTVQQELDTANAALPFHEKALTKAQRKKNFVARNGVISASVAAASLGILWWNKK